MALARQPELWDTETLRTRYPESPHHACSDILLFFNEIPDDPAELLNVADDKDVRPYPAWDKLPQVRPIVFDLMRRVEGVRLGRLMITRLPPGKTIPPHQDQGAPASYYERYQLPLQSLPGCVFRAADEAVQMRSGEVWRFDNQQTHSVENFSADDRIALIADIRSE